MKQMVLNISIFGQKKNPHAIIPEHIQGGVVFFICYLRVTDVSPDYCNTQ